MGRPEWVIPKDDLAQTSVLVELDPAHLDGSTTRLEIGVYSGDRLLETVQPPS